MKKALMLLTAAVVLTMSAVCVSASTTLEDYIPVKDKYTISYDVGTTNAAGMYGIVAIKGTNTLIDTSNLENIYYIDQTSANSDGIITFSEFAPKGVAPSHKDFTECTVYIGGPGFDTAEEIGTLKKGELGIFVSGKVVDGEVNKNVITVTAKNAMGEILSTTQTEADGTFSIPVAVGENCSIVISKGGYCTYTITGLNLENDLVLSDDIDISSLAGDIAVSNDINFYDLKKVLDDYNKQTTDPDLLDINADINGTTDINFYDLKVVLDRYYNESITKAYSAQ